MERSTGLPIYGDLYGKQFQPRVSSASQPHRASHGGHVSGGKQLSMGHHVLDTSQHVSHLGQNVFSSDVYGNTFSQACYLPAMTAPPAVSMNFPEKTQNSSGSSGYGAGGSNRDNCSSFQSKSSSQKGMSNDGTIDGGCGEVPCSGHVSGGKSTSYQHQHSGSGVDSRVSSSGTAAALPLKKYSHSSKSEVHYHQKQDHQQASNNRQISQQSSSSSSASSSSSQHRQQQQQQQQQHNQSNIQTHYGQKPTPKKPLKQLFCDYCGKQFAQEYLMLNHRRTHTGERPFPCDFCGKHFGRKDTLQRHRRNHKPDIVPGNVADQSSAGLLKSAISAGMDHLLQESDPDADPDLPTRDKMMNPYVQGSGGEGNSSAASNVFVEGNEGEIGTMVIMPFSHGDQKVEATSEPRHDGTMPSGIPKSSKTYQCEICLKRFAQRHYLSIHRRTHTGEKPYQCDYCIQKFARRDTLLIHRRTQHTGERPHHCELCGEAFFHRGQLQMHLRSKHVLKSSNSNVVRENNVTPGNVGDADARGNDIGEGEVINHSNSSGRSNTDGNNITMGMVNTNPGMMVYRKRYQCDYCYKQFAQRYYLQIHRRIHTGEKLLQCDVCLKNFTQRHYLVIHRRTHTGEKPFQCDFCIQKFARKTTLQIHRRMHTGERPFSCDVCHKRFAQRDKLTVHQRTHSPKKRYRCDICLKLFAQRHYLQLHQRSHTGERPYQCGVCFKQFARKNSLQMHHRSHTGEKPYQCEVCFKQFAQRQYLQLHKRTHTGEKAYECNICAKHFARRDTLQRHMRIHTKHLVSSVKSNEEQLPSVDPYTWQL